MAHDSLPLLVSSRRAFLVGAGGAAAAAAVDGSRSADAAEGASTAAGGPPRRNRAAQIRHQAEINNKQLGDVAHPTNGDEARYPTKLATYTKGLPHDTLGEVDLTAYGGFTRALTSENPADFEAITLGCPHGNAVKLTNPQAGLAFDLEGVDGHQLAMLPAPAFASAEEAGEMTELYWMALLRDTPFLEYETSPLAQSAAQDLSRLSDFRGPKAGGRVTPATLFRDVWSGGTTGPYISQFLYKGTPFGAEYVSRQMRTILPGDDHLTTYPEWLHVQNGCPPTRALALDPVRRYIRNGRDLAQWVHIDVLFQAYFNAMLILLQPPDAGDAETGGGIAAALNPRNPYLGSRTQIGFGTFGGPHIATLVCEVATRALKAVWFQKWFVHRRLRPEMFAGRIHNHRLGVASYPLHADVLGSSALAAVFGRTGSHLLPVAFPEGSPTHPSYGAGHATVAGACVTLLKALFDERQVIPNPVVPTPDGLALVPYVGPSLTVGGELNKLASNVATGRNIAGVHWRSDAVESMKLGEAVAIALLRDQRETYNETFSGFEFTKFDGTRVIV
jgi:membrane-associated phospholipid phosphatase